jgi:ATP-dependent RNA helicase RhlE
MEGRDLKGLAQTGTGKTLAFLLPSMNRLLVDPEPGRTRLLVVTPTRELAAQVAAHGQALARYTQLRVVAVYGGESMAVQTAALRAGADVVVATPGRLLDHVSRRTVRLDRIAIAVLDEADRMLDMGFIPDVRRIFGLLPTERQTLLFGATLPSDVETLSAQFQRDPELIEVARQLPPVTLEQRLYPVGRHLKVPLLVHLLRQDPDLVKVLVFAETKAETDVVARRLEAAGLRVAAMHGDRPQKERESALQRLRDGDLQVLVATNLAARGLDIMDLSHVVNYDMPQTVDDYIHRVGRTARGQAEGTAYTFMAPGDEAMVVRIEAVLGAKLARYSVEGFDYDVPTPSWARASAADMARSLHKPGKARFSRSLDFRRR